MDKKEFFDALREYQRVNTKKGSLCYKKAYATLNNVKRPSYRSLKVKRPSKIGTYGVSIKVLP